MIYGTQIELENITFFRKNKLAVENRKCENKDSVI